MDPAELAALKEYLHVDHDEDDGLIQRLYGLAKRYLLGADGQIGDGELSQFAVFGLVRKFYDDMSDVPGLQAVINQVKLDGQSIF